ncbi:MAG: hypothetical protein DRN12_00155 [Thermoplasmata archaeon]|nr:MAG: hypothetical protein DRN12_00155 [Thermoplasmata archaeon]
MEIIALIHIKKHRIVSSLTVEQLKDIQFGGKKTYVLDGDGILKDKPNVSLYQQMARYHEIWVDAGPRNLGDLVDIIIAGANIVIIRIDRWLDFNIDEIRELTDTPVYLMVKPTEEDRYEMKNLASLADGLVLFTSFEDIRKNFVIEGVLRDLSKDNKVYAYEDKPEYIRSWESIGVKGLLVNIDNLKEFREYGS